MTFWTMKEADFFVAMNVTKNYGSFLIWNPPVLTRMLRALDASARTLRWLQRQSLKETRLHHSATGTVWSFLPRIQRNIFDNLHHQFFLPILHFIYYKSSLVTELVTGCNKATATHANPACFIPLLQWALCIDSVLFLSRAPEKLSGFQKLPQSIPPKVPEVL